MTASARPEAPTRLARRLGTADAVVLGLGSMIGAGVFAAFGAAADAAGDGLLVALGIAAIVAYCNATSSAQLAAVHPQSGGAYIYGRERLGPAWGFLAGWAFVLGKLASCAAMALTFATHADPALARPLAVAATLGLTAANTRGVKKTVALTRAIVAVVLLSLSVVVLSVWLGGAADAQRAVPTALPPRGVLEAAGLLFFAFAGYARIATLGEEVIDPARTIPRAIPLALGIALAVYAIVGVSALAGAGAPALAASSAPLAAAVEAGSMAWTAPVVRGGACIASLGVLLSLLVGVSRTAFAMASNGDLPRALAAVDPVHRVPARAEIVTGVLVAIAVATADVRTAIGFSSFAVLGYYAIANAAAWTLRRDERRWPRALSGMGLLGCIALAASLPVASVVAGAAVLGAGLAVHLVRSRPPAPPVG